MTRYDRQTRVPEIGEAGQRRLAGSTAVLVGVGGLGAPAALYLAAAGVGTLRLVDFDRVDESNLHRQVLYTEADVGRSKVLAAADRLRQRNGEIVIETVDAPFRAGNAMDILRGADVVLDGTDAFATRYLVNDAARLAAVPNVFASVSLFDCQVTVSNNGSCYRCLFPEPPPPEVAPSCAEAGVLGVVPGIGGVLQATEALKLLMSIGDSLSGRLLLADLLGMRFREIEIERDPACPLCGDTPQIRSVADSARFTEAACGPSPDLTPSLSVADLRRMLEASPDQILLDVRSREEHAVADLGGHAHIPLPELADRMGELERGRTIVVYCQSGGRSAVATRLLTRNGFDAVSLEGGMAAWSEAVGPGVSAT